MWICQQVNFQTAMFSHCQIQVLLTKYSDIVSSVIGPWENQLRSANPYDSNELRSLYTAIYNSGQMQPLNRNNCATAPAVSLVLFFDCNPQNPQLQHSMLIRDTDEWIGANNVGSLCISDQDYSPLGINVSPTDVWCFPNMSQRIYVAGKQGGWQGNNMASIFSGGVHSHNLFYIPVL